MVTSLVPLLSHEMSRTDLAQVTRDGPSTAQSETFNGRRKKLKVPKLPQEKAPKMVTLLF